MCVNSFDKLSFQRPSRPCPYCKKLIGGGKLKRHIATVHKLEDEVAENLSNKKLNAEFFVKKRLEGILMYNKKIYEEKSSDNSILMRERKPKYDFENKGLKMCNKCNKFVGSHTFYKHKCDLSKSISKGIPLRPRHLTEEELHHDEEFMKEVLSRFQENEVGRLCRSNEIIKQMGYRIFCKRRHEKEKIKAWVKSTMAEMRALANLFLLFKTQEGAPENADFGDMFRSGVEHTRICFNAIKQYGMATDGQKIKYGAKLNIRNVIMRTTKHLKAIYDELGNRDKVTDIEAFIRQFNFHEPELFGEASYRACERTFERRRPEAMPDDAKVTELHSFIKERIKLLVQNFKINDYVELRNFTISRLTLYNARRGEEGTQMCLNEWEDAKKGVWIEDEAKQPLNDPGEMFLTSQFLLAYIRGKGKKFVPVLVPNDCIEAIDILVNKRLEYGVRNSNIFVFASRASQYNCSGWHAVNKVISMQPGLPLTFNATLNRHRVSTIYASLDLTPANAKIFFQHVSHTEDISRENYRCPPGLKETLVMAPLLNDISEGMFF